MKKIKISRIAVILLCAMIMVTINTEAKKVDAAAKWNRATTGLRRHQNHRWFMANLPELLYNLCAVYYVMPDCLTEMFGEEFDISSMIEQICPSA